MIRNYLNPINLFLRISGFAAQNYNSLLKEIIRTLVLETVVPAKGDPNAGKTLQLRYNDTWMNREGKWPLMERYANNVCS